MDKPELDEEVQFFERNRADWLKQHSGKWALVSGEKLAGMFETAEKAYVEGLTKFGNVSFLVKQVTEKDTVEHSPALMLGTLHASS